MPSTAVSDSGLQHLKQCSALEDLSVHDTRVTLNGLMELKRVLPKLDIHCEAIKVSPH